MCALIACLQNETLCGLITDILIQKGSGAAVAVIDVLSLVSERHSVFGMPYLQRRHGEELLMIVPPTLRLCHDLSAAYP